MNVFVEVLAELGSMFFGTPRLAAALLIVIAASAALARFVDPSLAGAALLLGCLGVLAENVLFEARHKRS